MKKVLFGLVATLLTTLSFGQTLSEKISVNKNFISLMNNFDEVVQMPSPEKFVAEFDKNALLEKGNPYISSISGMQISRVENINKDIEINIQNLKKNIS